MLAHEFSQSKETEDSSGPRNTFISDSWTEKPFLLSLICWG